MQAAIQRLRNRKDREEGFTLIELMVVVLIIAILIAFAIPTFLGARRRAQDRNAQASDRNTLSAADTIYSDNQTYTDVDAAALGAEEPSIQFVDGGAPSTGPKEVSVEATDANNLYMVAKSDSGKCFAIWSNKAVGGNGVQFASDTPCDAGVDLSGEAWGSEF